MGLTMKQGGPKDFLEIWLQEISFKFTSQIISRRGWASLTASRRYGLYRDEFSSSQGLGSAQFHRNLQKIILGFQWLPFPKPSEKSTPSLLGWKDIGHFVYEEKTPERLKLYFHTPNFEAISENAVASVPKF